MNNSCLPEYIFSEANCRCLLTHKSAFCYKQRKISSPKVIFCLHFEAGPLVSPATRLPQPSRWPCSGLGTVTRWHHHRGLRGEHHNPKTGGLFFSPFPQSGAAINAASSAAAAAPAFPGTAAPTSPPAAAGTGRVLGRGERAAPRCADRHAADPAEGCEPTHPARARRAG